MPSSDIVFVYSGGDTNSDPDNSLGGRPSSTEIPGTLNNLFSDVTPAESTSGNIDYRCFYVFNDSLTNAIHNCKLFIASQVIGGAFADIGVLSQNDQQAVTLQGQPDAGTMTLIYETFPFTVTFHLELDQFAEEFKNQLEFNTPISGANVKAFNDNNAVTLIVDFEGEDGNKFQPLFQVFNNAINGCSGIVCTKLRNGSPVNAIAPTTTPMVPPPGVIFSNPNAINYLLLGTLMPGDGFPVWTRRTTSPLTDGIRNDGFLFRMAGQPLPASRFGVPATYSYTAIGGISVEGDSDSVDHGPGEFFADMSGGIMFIGEADYIVDDGSIRYYYIMSGGIDRSLDAPDTTYSYIPLFSTSMSGGPSVSSSTSALATTTGITFVSSCQVWGCETFPISWMLSVSGSPNLTYCGCQFLSGSRRMDFFNQNACAWRTSVTTDLGYNLYYELQYSVVDQIWDLQAHAVFDPQSDSSECIPIHIKWHRADWNCCGHNGLDNAFFIGGNGSCILIGFTLDINPIKYCTPAPCQYACGKCCRTFKMPNHITLQVGFDQSSACGNSPMVGTFTMARNLVLGPCAYTAAMNVPPGLGGGSSWIMQYDDVTNQWLLYTYDPEFRWNAQFVVSDRNFSCCGLCDSWVFVAAAAFGGSCTGMTVKFASTSPADPLTCQ